MVFTVNDVEYLMCTEKIPVPLRIAKDGPQLNFGFNDVDYPFKDNSYEASLRIGLPQIKKLLEKLLRVISRYHCIAQVTRLVLRIRL